MNMATKKVMREVGIAVCDFCEREMQYYHQCEVCMKDICSIHRMEVIDEHDLDNMFNSHYYCPEHAPKGQQTERSGG